MKNLKATLTLLLGAFVVLGLSACAEGTGDGPDADTTDTAAMTTPPADTGMGGMQQDTTMQQDGMAGPTAATYSEWDANGDGELTEDEFWSGVWNEWDANGDGELTEDEFNEGADWLFGDDYQYGWSDWDADGDGTLTEAEFEQGWGQYDDGLFDDADANGAGWLSEQEFTDVTFGGTDGGGM